MPYGKYAGRVLLDLPEEYLLWLDKKGWPKGELGELLQLLLMIKTDGSEGVLNRLRCGQKAFARVPGSISVNLRPRASDPVDGADRSQVDDMAGSFRSNGYQLKRVFAEAAAYCKGD